MVFLIFLYLQFFYVPTYGLGTVNMPQMLDTNLTVEIVYQGIRFPTSMAFLGPNDIAVLEKDNGTVRRIVNGSMINEPLLDAAVSNKGERGMLGIAVHDDKIFLYYTESSVNEDSSLQDPLGNRLYRYELKDNKLSNPKLLLDVPSYSSSHTGYHVGGRLLIGPDENIYIVVGDTDKELTKTQNIDNDKSSLTSAILRLTQEGDPAPGNPIDGGDPVDKYYAYGIRNSFGIDFDPVTGDLWDTENGPNLNDEINRVEPGFNSGWRRVQGLASLQDNYDSDKLVRYSGSGKYSDPEFVWNLTVAPTALKFLDSNKYGDRYKNDLFVGDVNKGYLYHFELNSDRTGLKLEGQLEDKIANNPEEEELNVLGKGFGGIVDIAIGPDGFLYVLSISGFRSLDSPLDSVHGEGTIYRIVPRLPMSG
jgi:glucose/arabinose dehydrogenase